MLPIKDSLRRKGFKFLDDKEVEVVAWGLFCCCMYYRIIPPPSFTLAVAAADLYSYVMDGTLFWLFRFSNLSKEESNGSPRPPSVGRNPPNIFSIYR